MHDVKSVGIVGASAAGIAVAESLRRHGFEGEIVLIGDERVAPYDRPPLSKQVLSGAWEPGRASLLTDARADVIGATHLVGVSARGLGVDDRVVLLDDGREMRFDDVVIATGVRSRPLPGDVPEEVHMLRTLDDANRLRGAFASAERLLVIGGGFLGLEVAATARGMGLEVSVVEPTENPLADRLGATTAQRILTLHRSHGVDFRLGRSVAEFLVDSASATSSARGVMLDDGSTVRADVVLVAIGSLPNVDWLKGSGLDISNGVVCDSLCRAAPHVWAAGDVARWTHDVTGESLRLEHRTNATEQGDHVAKNILGAGTPYTPVPFVWSDQYDVKIQSAGFVGKKSLETVAYGDVDGDSFVLRFELAGRTLGAVGWNAAKALLPIRRELLETFANLGSTTIGIK